MKLAFRPHHFLCTLGFQGKGYAPSFIKNYTDIVETLQKNEEFPIDVVAGFDSICAPCPHKGAIRCAKEEKIQGFDARHSQILEIVSGSILTWKESKQRLKEKMTLEAFHQACAGCEWKSLGVCEAALKKLQAEPL
jgi:hypothetical protein